MEGLPRMPMLSVELKFSPASADFGPKLKAYIAQVYEEDPETYSKEIDELNVLRDNATKAPADFIGCSTLKKYFAQLYLLKNRFPMEEGDAACVPFTWYEKFSDMPSPLTYDDIRYELACILHNIGAVHSYLATVDSRLSPDGMKVSCTHFQCAAWAFQTMRDDAEPFRFNGSSFSADFDRNILNWYSVLMLAQAQECILEKSLVDNRKSHIIAKVATQVSEFYAQAIRILDESSVSDVIGSSKCRSWKKFIDMKRKFYRAISYYELGVQAEEQQKMGERLAYFQAASNDLTDATKLGQKDSSEALQQSLQFAHDVITARLNQSKKENDFIYHEKVPAIESLPELKGASLVKAIPFDPLDADVAGVDIFKRLVPLDVHRSSSLYSEEKAKMLRRISEGVDAKNASLDEFMMSLKVDQLLLDVDFSQLPLPEALIERCAAFNAKPSAVSDLLSQMSKLTNSFQDVEAVMLEIEKKLHRDLEEARSAVQVLYGADDDKQSKLPNDIRSSIFLRLKAFRDDLERYRRAHEQATKANADLHKALGAHSENLQTLSLPLSELKKQLPTPPSTFAESPETTEMKRLLGKVSEMKRQRDTLMEQLREQIRDDDVTKALLAAKDEDEQELFEKEKKKHEKQIGIIEQNLAAQENILKALTESNAKYGEIRKQVNSLTKQRDAKIMNLVAAYDVYTDLELKSKDGIEFYGKLRNSLDDLDAALSKWREADLGPLISKSRAEAERKKTAAMELQTSSRGSTPTSNEPSGPKLKDYMAYYRAKKAGQMAAFPVAGVNEIPPMADVSLPSLPSTATSAYSATGLSTAANGFHPAIVMPSTAANGFYPSSGLPSVPSTVSNGYHPPSGLPSIPSSASNGYHPATGLPSVSTAAATGFHPAVTTTPHHAMPMYAMPQNTYFPVPSSIPVSNAALSSHMNVSVGPAVQTPYYSVPGSVPNAVASSHTNFNSGPGVVPMSTVVSSHANIHPGPGAQATFFPAPAIPAPNPVVPHANINPPAVQMAPGGFGYNSIFLEPVAFGSDYVQLRWRYDGPKPVKYMITFRGYQRYDTGMGRIDEVEVDTGAPVKVDVDHHIVHNLRADTMYAFEVSVVDEASGRIFVKSPTVRVTTSSLLL